MHLTYTVAGLCMFLFAAVAAAWSHSVADQCGNIVDSILLALTNNAQQCQYAQTLYPTGIVFMGIGAAVGIGGLTIKDQDEVTE